jgi:hypothetical protein
VPSSSKSEIDDLLGADELQLLIHAAGHFDHVLYCVGGRIEDRLRIGVPIIMSEVDYLIVAGVEQLSQRPEGSRLSTIIARRISESFDRRLFVGASMMRSRSAALSRISSLRPTLHSR